jgi:hypothetical protein
MHPLQEKFQVILPTKEENGEQWVSFESQRDLNNEMEWCCDCADDTDPRKFNLMPPGMDIGSQWRSEQNQQPLSMAGVTDVSKDTTTRALVEGYTKRKMRGTDDAYTGEHVDHFYGDAGGFAERNNYLDRS